LIVAIDTNVLLDILIPGAPDQTASRKPSVDTSNPASRGHPKTGQSRDARDTRADTGFPPRAQAL
jgi:hypothetical protein